MLRGGFLVARGNGRLVREAVEDTEETGAPAEDLGGEVLVGVVVGGGRHWDWRVRLRLWRPLCRGGWIGASMQTGRSVGR